MTTQDILVLVGILAVWLWVSRRFMTGGHGGC
ncbi:MAG TPA: hypothetical protein DEF41_08275 [Desulfovibrio sp.]|uniref:Uncharacterized protein n=1 Tax=Nitratidesulfovibrio vulgaris (strain ATCC 29579 / DSM 644 / CCUG 34227 / NCIMB 8303 / VKM B-1760 / Hildenborough) TaxID=882 RepID=Q72DY6_NITV2|nr:hypothetical protein DVU_0793 [Nitratidesulfovibrio vulgaris str. Hildenborough]HBW16115.1 hypothetical protein [Desulfovibrio sp.]